MNNTYPTLADFANGEAIATPPDRDCRMGMLLASGGGKVIGSQGLMRFGDAVVG